MPQTTTPALASQRRRSLLLAAGATLAAPLTATAQASGEELSAHCHALISGFKCPKSYEFRDKLPLTAAGKVQKTELRKTAARA